jgi:hypothetical protein
LAQKKALLMGCELLAVNTGQYLVSSDQILYGGYMVGTDVYCRPLRGKIQEDIIISRQKSK